MFVNLVVTRVRHLLLAIIGIFKRALCCFSRRRKPSLSECELLCSVDVIADKSGSNSVARYNKNVIEKDWNSWDDSPRTVEEHIERYREQLSQPLPQPEVVKDQLVDFFEDMTPKILTQQRICISNESDTNQFSRLTANMDIPVVNDLEDWNDGDRMGWDDADDSTTKQLIRAARKELRAQRNQNRQQLTGPAFI